MEVFVGDDKDTKKLTAEELEKRVAPMALSYSEPTDPATSPAPTTPQIDVHGGHGNTGGHGGQKNQV